MDSFSLDVRTANQTAEITATGEVDLHSAEELGQSALGCLDDPHITALVIDLSAVTFLDSAGLSVLVRTRNRALELGKQLTLREPSERVASVLKIVSLDTVFNIDPALTSE